MKVRTFIAITASLCISAPAFAADEGETLFNNNGCGSCHALAKSGVGPSLKDIAAKYAGDKKAQAMMEKKVRSGGSGSFPSMPMPMPATAESVSDANIKAMVKWILSIK
jgi:cytochrome c